LIRVAREEFFGAGYSPDMFCPSCVAEMVRSVYVAYERFKAEDAVKNAGTIISDAPIEFIELPVIVHASSPSNKTE
jgi:hypothetical protein